MKRCIACGCELPGQALFTLENAPASAQDIPDEREVKDDSGVTLQLYQCEHCGLVQFGCGPVSYYRDVIRAGGFSTTMRELRHRQYGSLIETYHLEGKKFLEVGCGRGEFLQVLKEFPVQVYGMEHRAELVRIAQEEGLCVWREFPETCDQQFAADCAEDRPAQMPEAPFDVFLSFNFLEHQPRPDVMLRAIRRNLAVGGMGLVTVPSLEYILEKESYYELIRDHIAYYTIGTLRSLMEHNGFEVLEAERINRDTLSVVVRKTEMPAGAGRGTAESPESAQAPADIVSAEPLVRGCRTTVRDIEALFTGLAAEGKTLAVWGASHQGFTLTATTALRAHAKYIIDSAPFKQGRFAPASHLPIVAPEHFFSEPVDAILIVAPGYSDEIAGIIRRRFGDGVRILTIRSDRLEELT